MPNKYVDFVSDEDFLECVKWVCEAYPDTSQDIDMEKLHKNTLDPFKVIFDMLNGGLDYDTWITNESVRQNDKTINNRIGDFHQKLLGKVRGWKDLGTGDTTKVDLKKEDDTVFIELKNKENTVNADSKDKVRDKLERVIRHHPNAEAYWAYILSKKGDSGRSVWKYKGKVDPKINTIWGKDVYELITGDRDALEKVWKALPNAIEEVLKLDSGLEESEINKLVELFSKSLSE